MVACAPDYRDQFTFVLHQIGRILRYHDRLAVCDQRVVGAVADIGLRRQVGLLSNLLGDLANVLRIIHAGGVEGRRHDRHQQLHVR